MNSSSLSLKDEDSFSPNEKYYFGPTRLLTKRIHLKSNDGSLDFTITGGKNFQSIQIDSVVWNSQAYLQGMRPGDQIISVNGIDFKKNINYTQALQVRFRSLQIYIKFIIHFIVK
jgi:predicted metalloprotease with PDZ domain